MIDDAQSGEMCDVSAFIGSGLRAARHSKPHARRSILRDVATVLGCEAAELDFLFAAPCLAANDSDPVIMPDFRARLCDTGRLAAAE